MPKTKIAINAARLATAIRAVIPHADAVKTRVLSSVSFQVIRGALAVVATDSHTLGCYRIPEAITEDFTARISLGDARRLAQMAGRAHNIHDVTLTCGGLSLEAESFSGKLLADDLGAEHFPAWEHLVAARTRSEPDELPGAERMNAHHLARFSHAVPAKEAEIVLHRGPQKGLTVVTAPNFVGVIMPAAAELAYEWWVPGSKTPAPKAS